jgi:hypothetical protein
MDIVEGLQMLIESNYPSDIKALMCAIWLDHQGLALDGNGWFEDCPLYQNLTEEDHDRISASIKEILQTKPV